MGRPCMILCNFNEKELKVLKAYGGIMGIKDQIIATYKNGNTPIKDILENNILEDCEDCVKNKAIIFNDLSNVKVSAFIDNMKKMKIAQVMKGVVTETSMEWPLKRVLDNFVAEKKAEKLGKEVEEHL